MSVVMSLREIFQRTLGGPWYYELNRRRKSLRTKDEKVALRRFRAIQKMYLDGKISQINGECSMTLSDYIEEFLEWADKHRAEETCRGLKMGLNHLKKAVGESTRLDRLTSKHWDVVRSNMSTLKPRTINVTRERIVAALEQAVIWGYLKANPLRGTKGVPTMRRAPSFIPPQDVPKFLASIKDIGVRQFCASLVYTGRRQGELLSLTWDNVNLAEERYTAFLSKQKRWETFPMHSMFKSVLKAIPRASDFVFPRWTLTTSSSPCVKQALKDAGWGHLRAHDLRHTFASMTILAGNDLKTAQDLLGHNSLRSTEIYAHLTREALAEGLRKISGAPVDLCGQIAYTKRFTPRKS
jgi:integrase